MVPPLAATEEKSISSNDTWVSLVPEWANEFIVDSARLFGQNGMVEGTFTGKGDTWTYDVMLEYGY